MSTTAPSAWRFGPKILVPLIVAALAASGLAVFGIQWATARSDEISIERQVRTTERAIDDIVARLAQEQETIAIWDDPINHLTRPRPDFAWIHANVGQWFYGFYGHDDVYILNAHDQPIYGSNAGRMVPVSRFEAIRPDVQDMIDETRGRLAGGNGRYDRHPGRRSGGATVLTTPLAVHDTKIARLRGRPAAVSAMLMMRSTAAGRLPGVEPMMVSIRYLDGRFLRDLEYRSLIAHPRISLSNEARDREERLVLNSEDGVVAHFFWQPELPGSRIRASLIRTTSVLVVAMIVLLGILALWLRRSTGELQQTLLRLSVSEAQAQHLAFHDVLTGLPNRALFNDRVDHALALARRGGGLTLLMLDLDRLKHVNDTMGHLAGDALIREFGARMAALLREGDTVARLGGDEFAILLPGVAGRDDAAHLCDRILAAVGERFDVLGSSAFVGVSIGVAMAPDAGLDRVELVRKADIALYRAKAEGRGCYRLFSPCMDERIRFRSAIEDDLRAALDSGQGLLVHYQPEIGGDGTSIVGLEALVRWQHPERGLIQPETFVPVAEETGLIGQLGEWVLAQACAAARRWPDLFVAVNLSPVQFRSTGFAERAIAIIRSAGVEPSRIELEVTEGVLLDDDDLVRAALARLRAAGIRIALDDFGTGYSSLSYLRKFEVDKIKIDRSFIQHLGHRVDSASIVAAVVSIGHAMGLTVTAEGVETAEQRKFLKVAGCNQMQGYLFSRALPEEELGVLLGGVAGRRSAA